MDSGSENHPLWLNKKPKINNVTQVIKMLVIHYSNNVRVISIRIMPFIEGIQKDIYQQTYGVVAQGIYTCWESLKNELYVLNGIEENEQSSYSLLIKPNNCHSFTISTEEEYCRALEDALVSQGFFDLIIDYNSHHPLDNDSTKQYLKAPCYTSDCHEGAELYKLEKKIEHNVTRKVTEKLIATFRNMDLIGDECDSKKDDTKLHRQVRRDKIHRNIYCDHCNVNIAGVRYKCIKCPDYDLCEKCESLVPNVHNEDHFFLKITTSLSNKWALIPENWFHFFQPTCTLSDDSSSNNFAKCKTSEKSQDKSADFINLTDLPTNGSNVKNKVTKCEKRDRHIERAAKKCEKLKARIDVLQKKHNFQTSDCITPDFRQRRPIIEKLHSKPSSLLCGFVLKFETISEYAQFSPGEKFKKVWRVRNTGNQPWNKHTVLRWFSGDAELQAKGQARLVKVPHLKIGEEGDIKLEFITPMVTSRRSFSSYWRMHHQDEPFGLKLSVKIIVQPREIPVVGLETQKRIKSLTKDLIEMSKEFVLQNKEATNLSEAIEAVRAIRSCDVGELKKDVKSHTATPNSTPFNVSPPKSPEPKVSQDPSIRSSTVSSYSNLESSNQEKEDDDQADSDVDSFSDIETLEKVSCISDSSNSGVGDEFVIVPLPKCFDLFFNEDIREEKDKTLDDVNQPENEEKPVSLESAMNEEKAPLMSQDAQACVKYGSIPIRKSEDNQNDESCKALIESDFDNDIEPVPIKINAMETDLNESLTAGVGPNFDLNTNLTKLLNNVNSSVLNSSQGTAQHESSANNIYGHTHSIPKGANTSTAPHQRSHFKHSYLLGDYSEYDPEVVCFYDEDEDDDFEMENKKSKAFKAELSDESQPSATAKSLPEFTLAENLNDYSKLESSQAKEVCSAAKKSSSQASVPESLSAYASVSISTPLSKAVSIPSSASEPAPIAYPSSPKFSTSDAFFDPTSSFVSNAVIQASKFVDATRAIINGQFPSFKHIYSSSDNSEAPNKRASSSSYFSSNSVYHDSQSSESERNTKRSSDKKRLMAAMDKLLEMGFWNRELNEKILEKNKYDVNLTINELLNPQKGRKQTESEVVSSQPRQKGCSFDEFD